jgi:hypothetical protein
MRSNVIRIISEMGPRPYKELMPMRKDEVDLKTGCFTSRAQRRWDDARIIRERR